MRDEWDLCPCPGCISWLIESDHACRRCEEINLMNEEAEIDAQEGGYFIE